MVTLDYKTQIVELDGVGARAHGGNPRPAAWWKTCARDHEYNSLSNKVSTLITNIKKFTMKIEFTLKIISRRAGVGRESTRYDRRQHAAITLKDS